MSSLELHLTIKAYLASGAIRIDRASMHHFVAIQQTKAAPGTPKCGAPSPDAAYMCSRAQGHPGGHAAHRDSYPLLVVWHAEESE